MKFKPRPKSSSIDSNNFVKIEPGHSIEGVFRGEPHEFQQHWPKGGEKTICTGDKCVGCAAGQKRQFRFMINFVTRENAVFVAKVIENSGKVYDTLAALQDSGYDLAQTIVRITRIGNGKDTIYNILPKPNGVLTKELDKAVAAVKLVDLANPETAASAPANGNDGASFT